MASFIIDGSIKTVDLQQWADITIEKWKWNIAQKNLIHTGDLIRSFEATVTGEANGNLALINFAFNYYFRMLEMGVGKGNLFGMKRQRYGLFTRPFMHEVYRLSELVSEMYANNAAVNIVNGIGDGLKSRI